MKTINERLADLRALMREEGIMAFIFPSTDPHNSEYVAGHWKGREWISGFNGSAGTAVVTLESAALWTDSRYFISAAEQLADTEYELMSSVCSERQRWKIGWYSSWQAMRTPWWVWMGMSTPLRKFRK